MLEELLRTVANARQLLVRRRLGGEVVDTRVKAALDQASVQPHKVLHLLLLDDALHLTLLARRKHRHCVSVRVQCGDVRSMMGDDRC